MTRNGTTHCPACASGRITVIDSRPARAVRLRSRRCMACDHRWKTIEQMLGANGLDRAVDALRAAEAGLADARLALVAGPDWAGDLLAALEAGA